MKPIVLLLIIFLVVLIIGSIVAAIIFLTKYKNGGSNRERLRIYNNRSEDVFIGLVHSNKKIPLPGYSVDEFYIDSKGYLDIKIPKEGLANVELWVKRGCTIDNVSYNRMLRSKTCDIGNKYHKWKNEIATYEMINQDIDEYVDTIEETPQPNSSIYINFGCVSNRCNMNFETQDYIGSNTSLYLDLTRGFSYPFKVMFHGNDTNSGNFDKSVCQNCSFDLSKLGESACGTLSFDDNIYSLKKLDDNKNFIACFSPCEYLKSIDEGFTNQPNGDRNNNIWYYCGGDCIGPNIGKFLNGGIKQTDYYQTLNSIIPGSKKINCENAYKREFYDKGNLFIDITII